MDFKKYLLFIMQLKSIIYLHKYHIVWEIILLSLDADLFFIQQGSL